MEKMLKELQESVQELKRQQWQKGKPQAKQVSWGSSERVTRTLNGKPEDILRASILQTPNLTTSEIHINREQDLEQINVNGQ
ncbi:hypothetical protein OUZ56_010412 [Daphnia magna]|uniref:Uncharacterized protein n=1 Tax=Daphnia magna TaxID=35525 RepID=A0ABR0AIH8_9CRUS|nr:hypothetical protein OUZ56_010412 [Daphnia magna]